MVLKQQLQQRLVTFHASGVFPQYFFKKAEKIYVEL